MVDVMFLAEKNLSRRGSDVSSLVDRSPDNRVAAVQIQVLNVFGVPPLVSLRS